MVVKLQGEEGRGNVAARAKKYIQRSSSYASVQLQIVLCTERVTKDFGREAREIWCQIVCIVQMEKCFMFYDSVCSKAHEVNMPIN